MKRFYLFIALLAICSYGAKAQNRVIRIMQNGNVLNSFPVEQVDSIIVDEIIDTPSNLTATILDRSVILTWTKMGNATYDIYRSADNTAYTALATGVSESRYVDNSPMAGTNYYKIKAKINHSESEFSTSAMVTFSVSEMESGIYLGIMGFNQQLYSHSIDKLSDDSKAGFDSFIDNLTMKNGTLLYYSVDQAINTLQSVALPADLSTVAIVTFTDGLDQGSMMMDVPYGDDNEYLDALNYRIMNETVNRQPITAFSIGIRGQDVSDVTKFRTNLSKLVSSAENATEVTSMAEVNAKFKEIAEQLSQSNYIQTINLKMPGVSNGTLVRFTFDNVNSADKSTLYIEGTFNLTSRSLENVKYVGLTSTSGTTIKGVVDGIFVTFTFEGVHTANNKQVDNKFIDEWTYINSNNTWQINSEFDKTENSDIVTERSSAVIMLVLDCSSSLASDFTTAQDNAKDFINTLHKTVGGNNGSEENHNTIYSTTPKDLTLAIWKEGKRYYLTKEEYDKANLSDAVIEGLTIIAADESFILSLKKVQDTYITNTEVKELLYGDILPNSNQITIMNAKPTDINNALIGFGGDSYHSSDWAIRGVRPTDFNSAIYWWTDPNDLKLSVLIDGKREFLDEQAYNERKKYIDAIEGIAIIAGGEKFAIHLNDAQTDPISSIETAMYLYGAIIPTENQGIIISAKMDDINNALRQFGGTTLRDYYYSSITTFDDQPGWMYDHYYNCIHASGGYLTTLNAHDATPYIRGVTKLE